VQRRKATNLLLGETLGILTPVGQPHFTQITALSAISAPQFLQYITIKNSKVSTNLNKIFGFYAR